MRIPKPTMRKSGEKMIDVKVDFSIGRHGLIGVVAKHITMENSLPKNKSHAIELLKTHLYLFGQSYWDDLAGDCITGSLDCAEVWVNANFPEFNNA